jgi:hypothetical protein
MPSGRAEASAHDLALPTAPPTDARIAAIAAWLGQLSRTLKTCRLYDLRNPTAVKFREDLATQLQALFDDGGAFTLEFSADAVTCSGRPVTPAQSREENFAMPFHRDGMRTLTFNPGAGARELDVIVGLLLNVTSRASEGTEDLVTLLWAADLPHVDMSYIASETDADASDDDSEISLDEPAPLSGKLMPWPDYGGVDGGGPEGGPGNGGGTAGGASGAGTPGMPGATEPGSGAADSAGAGAGAETRLRSDDWLAGEPVDDLEQCFLALDASSAAQVERFVAAMREERGAGPVSTAIALVREVLRSDLQECDRPELADLLARALRESVGEANWADARDVVQCLAGSTDGWWATASLVEGLALPDAPATVSLVRHLDACSVSEIQEFVDFARGLGPAAIEWLMTIVSVATHQRTRRTLVRALGELCGGNPERLAPWLADPRWYVVRNAVVILGDTEGGAPAGLFRPLLRHPELRVRQAVVEALGNVDRDAALPLLLDMIHDPEASIRGAVLHRLGGQRNPRVSAALLDIVLDPGFRKRPAEDVRAFTSALGGAGDDDTLPLLEEQLYPPGWFSKGAGPHCLAIAHCIGRIGTPSAIARLEQGSRSRTPATRDACRLVLKGLGHA